MSIKQQLRKRLNSTLKTVFYPYLTHQRYTAVSKAEQILLTLRYREILRSGQTPLAMTDVGFTNFSQSDEDGILLYIFALIGMGRRRCVEMCAGDGVECNAANLIFYHAWQALLVDGNPAYAAQANAFYGGFSHTSTRMPTYVTSWITAENINDLFEKNGMTGEIDLFSLDVDGMDYWMWKALIVASPRVVVVEYQTDWGSDNSVTVPYSPTFVADLSSLPYYCGCSLPAWVNLGREKGYRLVGCNGSNYNAFFVRNDVGVDVLPEVDAADCINRSLTHLAASQAILTQRGEWQQI